MGDELVGRWMHGCPAAKLSFAKLWVPARVTTKPYQSLLSHLMNPNTKHKLVPPLPSVHAHCPSPTPSSLGPQPPSCRAHYSFRASRAAGTKTWNTVLPELPRDSTPSPGHPIKGSLLPQPSCHCLAHHSYILHSIYYQHECLLAYCLLHKKAA